MSFVEPVTLSERGVTLEPLALVHEDGLRAAAADGELWNIRVTSVPEPHQTRTYIEDALAMRAAGNRFAFAVRWRTDNFNFASQAAIERLGAKKDGVIRGHALRRDGTIRDTVMYSLRAGEWPEAKAQLLYLLERRR